MYRRRPYRRLRLVGSAFGNMKQGHFQISEIGTLDTGLGMTTMGHCMHDFKHQMAVLLIAALRILAR